MKKLTIAFLVCFLLVSNVEVLYAGFNPLGVQNIILYDDLEDSSIDQWRLFSYNDDGNIEITSTSHSGEKSLRVSGREHYSTAVGREISDVSMGDVLEVSAWIYQDTVEQADVQVSLLSEMTLSDGAYQEHRETVRAITIQNGQWKKVVGRVVVDYRDNLDNAYVVFHSTWRTKNNPFDLYVDDIEIKKVGSISTDSVMDLDAYYSEQFSLGATIHPDTLRGTTLKREMLMRNFTSVTAEGAFKPGGFLSNVDRGELDFTEADAMLASCIEAGLYMRGHTLVWNAATPDWFFRQGFLDEGAYLSEPEMEARLEWYIKNVMEHFNTFEDSNGNPIVYAWDVVNEMIDPSQPNGIKRGNWYDTVGDDVIDKSFEFARKYARSDVKLFYNDYDNPYRSNLILNILEPIRKAGNIDGIGIQGHWWTIKPYIESVDSAISNYDSKGYEVHITELDINMASFDETILDMPKELEEEQAVRYRQLFDVFSKYDCVTNVTFWGTTDNQSWLNFQGADHGDNISVVRLAFPLLFDRLFQPKRAVEVITRHEAATINLDAVEADEFNGVEVYENSIGYCDEGDWIKYSDVDLGNGFSYFAAEVAIEDAYDGGSFSIYLDAPNGSLLGSMEVQGTGGWQNYKEQFIPINGYGGVHDLYIVFNREGVGNFRGFKLENKEQTYQAEHFNESNGFSYSNLGINYCDAGKWIKFNQVDLANVDTMEARYGVPYNNFPVEIRIDSPDGELIGTLYTKNSGGWDSINYHVTETELLSIGGTHDVYIVFTRQGSGNYDWFRFYKK